MLPASPADSSIWPNTVQGWFALFLAVSGTVAILYSLYHFSLRPVTEKLEALRKEVEEQKQTRKTDNAEVNRRITHMEHAQVALNSTLQELQGEMTENKAERRYLRDTATSLTHAIEQVQDQTSEVLRTLTQLIRQGGSK